MPIPPSPAFDPTGPRGVDRTRGLEALLAQAAHALVAAGLFPEPPAGAEVHATEVLDDGGVPTLWGITVLDAQGQGNGAHLLQAPPMAVAIAALVAQTGVRLAPMVPDADPDEDPIGWPCSAPLHGASAHTRLAAFEAMADALAAMGWRPGMDRAAFLDLATRTPHAAWARG